MESQRGLCDEAIVQLIMEKDDTNSLPAFSDSENEDNVEVDDVESDHQYEPSDQEDSQQTGHGSSTSHSRDQVIDSPSPPDSLAETSGTSSSILTLSQSTIRSRNRHIWATSKGRTSGRATALNIVHVARGPSRGVRGVVDPLLLFDKFMTDQIFDEILKWTNAEIAIKKQTYEQVTSTFKDTCKEELRALVGILVLTAALKDNHLSLEELFNPEYSGTRYVSCMSKERCDFLLRCLRFDDKTFRLQRQKDDPFTPIRDIWDILITQCRLNYVPGTNVTIDEQLLAFRGRCKFRMYIPNKPAKYGLKLIMLCDSGTKYMIDCSPYLGKGSNTEGIPLGEFFVKELTRTIHGTHRNVSMDNWFTSVPLAKQLLQQPYKLSIVGTLRANKREIPEEIKNNRSRNVKTSTFCYDGPLTLLSYKPRPSKMVYLLSSCDEEGTVNPVSKKPHMIEFYNKTKGGVDTFDQMCSVMSCNRKTNRWPMCIFYAMINISCINAYVIYCHNASTLGQKIMSRRDFMKKLQSELVEPWLKMRLAVPTMPTHIKTKIQNILALNRDEGASNSTANLRPTQAQYLNKRKVCGLCSYKQRRMTKSYCTKCKTAICGEHKADFCLNCAQNN